MIDVSFGGMGNCLRRLFAAADYAARTDRELLSAFMVESDEDAFATLVLRHGGLVFRVCQRVLCQEQDAEDAFQAAIVVLARSAASIRKKDSLASWLHGVAYRTALKAKRNAARRRAHEGRTRTGHEPSAATQAARREVQAALEEILRLPERYRAPFVLCFLKGRSRAEAARELGTQEGTVWSRLASARKRLKERLSKRGIEPLAVLGMTALGEGVHAATVPARLARLRFTTVVMTTFLLAAGVGVIACRGLGAQETGGGPRAATLPAAQDERKGQQLPADPTKDDARQARPHLRLTVLGPGKAVRTGEDISLEVVLSTDGREPYELMFARFPQDFGIYLLGPWGTIQPDRGLGSGERWFYAEGAQPTRYTVRKGKPFRATVRLSEYFPIKDAKQFRPGLYQVNVKFYDESLKMAAPVDSGAVQFEVAAKK